jgi:predicted molibdopterin-dependent oxidoreductase YjgC
MIPIEIDGQPFSASEGESVLQVASANGIFIPALCAHPLLKPYGACRLCLVEVRQNHRTRLVAACAYPAQPGLVVRTASEQINELRRGIIELLLARCPQSPAVRALAGKLGINETRFPALGPTGERCILCGLCVRVCTELVGAAAISFSHRGVARRVDSPFSQGSADCLGCCACVAVCPTNAITVRLGLDSLLLEPFNHSTKLAHCLDCGRPVAPLPLVTFAKTRLPAALVIEPRCAECKANRTARSLATVAAMTVHVGQPSRPPVRGASSPAAQARDQAAGSRSLSSRA